MKVSEFISEVRSANKFLSDDDSVTDRHIFQVGRTIASLLIKQEIAKRRLLNSDNIFTPIECLCLDQVDLTECGVSSKNKARRTKEPLPELEEGIFGYLIQGVYNIDNSEEIYLTTNREFIDISTLRRKPNKKYYIVKNKYLYVLDPDIENINIYIYSPDNSYQLSDCESMYEADLKIPNYLKRSFYDMVNERLINYHKMRSDLSDNNMEDK